MNVSKLISILSATNAAEATIIANNGKLTIYSESESVKTYAEMESDISLPKIMVNVEQLSEALKRAEGTELVLTYEDSKLTLKTDNMSFAMNVKECSITIPIIPCPFYEYFETINFEGLKTAFTKVIDAASKDKARPHLAAVNVDGHKIMATDSFAMSVYDMERVPETFKDRKFALNSDFVKHILKVGKKERTANIYLTEHLFYVKLGDTIFISRVGEPFRLDYNRILKVSLQADHNALMDTGDVKKALKALRPTLKQVGNRLNFNFKENKVILKAGDFNLEIVSVYSSEPRQVTLNSKYVEVFLKTAGATMNMAIKNENAPVVMTTNNDENHTFVLMPIRTQ
jgi:DNA polymerase III sliding clamp (beta) subunit (PCNA family)